MVTGLTPSKLTELKKYRITGALSERYFTGGTLTSDGIVVSSSTDNVVINYFIGGIKYTDFFDDEGNYDRTEFSFEAQGTNSPDFIDGRLIKDSAKENIIGMPEVDNDVFIIRQSLSVFENQYRLRAISNLSELNFYAGGSNFNIISNT